jgi:tRNA(Ile)-lysidine synthase
MKSIILSPGNYVVAVSGGVDSVVLLYVLAESLKDSHGKVHLVVGHFDHGIRSDSHLDRTLVQNMAKKYGLPFVYQCGNLGAGTSEATARKARYDFLQRVKKASNATAIITAHHRDDMIETAIINLMRGTGRKGLSALADHPHLMRPLLDVSKEEIIQFAKDKNLMWREDSTNSDTEIKRNYIRKILLPRLGTKGRQNLLDTILRLQTLNRTIDSDLLVYLHLQPTRKRLDRHAFVLLPHTVSLEVLAAWLRSHNITTFDKKMLENIVVKIKTLKSGKYIDIDAEHKLRIRTDYIELIARQ